MAENSSTRIALASFSRTSLRRLGSTDVEQVLAKVDPKASTFIHVVHTGATVCAKILEHFGLPQVLAEHIDGGTALELDTSSDRYVFKKFRFVEERTNAGAVACDALQTGALIRGSETDRLTEGSGSIVVGEKFVLLFEGTLEGSTDTKLYREVARVRRGLNPLERSLMYMAPSSARPWPPMDPRAERDFASWRPISAMTASGSSLDAARQDLRADPNVSRQRRYAAQQHHAEPDRSVGDLHAAVVHHELLRHELHEHPCVQLGRRLSDRRRRHDHDCRRRLHVRAAAELALGYRRDNPSQRG
jgi:hypothetical protein